VNLRRQLLLVSLLLISLPWAGCQFVREMEAALQHGQEQALQSTARAIATILSEKPELLYPNLQRWNHPGQVSRQLYARAINGPIILDGYADGWDGPAHGRYGPLEYQARTRDGRLYLLFTITDDQVVYHDPAKFTQISGDRLVLRMANNRDYLIATAAPGPLQARYYNTQGQLKWEPRIRGHWQDSLTGYTLELELPLSMTGDRLGFYLINDSPDAAPGLAENAGNVDPKRPARTPWLVHSPQALEDLITPFADSGVLLSVIDRHHWVISRTGDLHIDTPSAQDTPWLLRALYRAILNGQKLPDRPAPPMYGQQVGLEISQAMEGQAASGWYASNDYGAGKTLVAASPVFAANEVAGLVVLQQNNEQYLSLTDTAFNRLLYYSLLAIAVSALGLLGYASWLSWRIRKLSAATSNAVQPDGSIVDNFPASHATDEIGDLSRAYAVLLDRLREYTDYLRTLSRKLSHELRTPIAVIRSSLDNLEQHPDEAATYLTRAREGTERLSNILTAMSEASHLEQSIANNDPVDFDLAQLCRDMFAAYRQLHPAYTWELECPQQNLVLRGVPDLMVQMLDKLVDNATGFTTPGNRICIGLLQTESGAELFVSNEGPALPQSMQGQLFDSMVSVRDNSDHLHLGLGLHVVRLIAEFHRGEVRAENLPDASGVKFSVSLEGLA
jgi:dedicated sortase system histidine kinase